VKLQGKIALIVGGSQSLGRAIASEFAAEGAITVINSRPHHEVPAIVTSLQQQNFDVCWEPGDMMDPNAMDEVVKRTITRFGRLDILVVSGAPIAAGAIGLFETILPAEYAAMMDSQFVSRLNCLRAALAPMQARKYGKVIFLTTDAGRTPTPGESLSGAAAAALMFFTRAAGRELAPKGIRVNCIAPSLTSDTPSFEYKKVLGPDHVVARAFAKIEAMTPFRLNVPSDIAKLALFLASPDCDQISGATISINGGLSFP